MNQEHNGNLALLREGRGVTVGSKYFTSVKDYCEHHGIEIPEQDREPEPSETEDVPSPSSEALSGFAPHVQQGEPGEVRTVLLGEWRSAADADQDESQILAISPEEWQESFQPRLDEVEALREGNERLAGELKAIKDDAALAWLPSDLRDRLVAIRGVGPALADTIVAALTAKSE